MVHAARERPTTPGRSDERARDADERSGACHGERYSSSSHRSTDRSPPMPQRVAATMVLAAILTLPTTTPAEETDPALFVLDGTTYRAGDLSARMRQLYGSILSDHYREMRDLVDEMVFDVYVEREAERQGRPVREVGAELLAVPEPDEADVLRFFEQNRERLAQSFEQVQGRIHAHLRRQAQLQRRFQILSRIKGEGGFELRLRPPEMPPVSIATRGQPVKGDPSAPITLVEFADYQCPNCARAVLLMKEVLDKYAGKVKLVHMDFPINSSGVSRQVAYGGVCAQAQGRFWAYHDAAYARQASLTKDSPIELAEELGLDLEDFSACMGDPANRHKVAASEQEGHRLGVTGTPTLFVDGRPFPSNHLLQDLGEYIDRKLGAGG
jgi:2-hydroxychromene-2-carboxylate isomerase